MKRETSLSIDSNQVILVGLLLISAWAFMTAFTFPARDRIYPQLASGIIFAGAVLLLAADLFPETLGRFGGTSESIFGTDEIEADEEAQAEDVNPMGRYKLITLMGVYLVAGYLAGLLWATPTFVLLYTVWTKQSLLVVASLTGLSYGIAYVFMTVLNLSIGSGVLLEVVSSVV